jgi:hypothetical protein
MNVAFIIILIILVVTNIVFIYLWQKAEEGKVQNCGSAVTGFAVKSGKTSNSVSQNCSGICIFSNLDSVTSAINNCNSFSFCNLFTYNSSTNTMSILNDNSILSSSLSDDVYIRQK